MPANRLLILSALLVAACQTGSNTGNFDSNPSATNPAGSTGGGNTTSTATGGGNATPSQPSATTVSSPRLIGRMDASTKLMTWAGTAVEAGFTGTGGTATFTTQTSSDSYIGVSIDGAAVTRTTISGGATQVTFGPVANGSHTVRFYKLNEADLGTVSFNSLTITGGQLTSLTPSGRRIEFIGDSITVGYGIEGNAPCTNTGALENSTKAWAWTAANTLNADASIVAISGRGLTRNAVGVNDSIVMPTYWQQLQAHDTTATYTFPAASTPQVVVVALGTNDYSYLSYSTGSAVAARDLLDQTAFVSAYQAFVSDIRAKYPSAFIVLASSPMLSDSYPSNSNERQWSSLVANLNAVVSGLGDSNMAVLSIATQNTNLTTGCESHPSATEAATMAAQLSDLIKTKLSW